MPSESILVVDDTPEIRENMAEILSSDGFSVDVARDGEEAIEILAQRHYDVVLTDLSMPRRSGLDVLRVLNEQGEDTVCILITGFGTIQAAVEAMRLGAFDFLTKPVKSDELRVVIDKALETRSLRRENKTLRQELRKALGFDRIVGKSPAIQVVFHLVEKVASADSTVLITGESGTGKELIAHAVHDHGKRKDRPFVPVNCAAIPAELLESELFGHEKGAFTHAIRTRIGRFELADKGTIFLDEIGDMPPVLQVKLLRVLQERAFERVGGSKTIHVDIRVIAATNVDLEEAVRQGRFREDLFYRLNVIPIRVPPLRERKADIPLLIEHFLAKFSRGGKTVTVDDAARRSLVAYDWPGNVRELENMMERLVILSNGSVVTREDLPERIRGAGGRSVLDSGVMEIPSLPEEGIPLNEVVNEFEKAIIIQALDRTNWIKNRAAKLLQMNRTTLIEKMKKQQINRARETAA